MNQVKLPCTIVPDSTLPHHTDIVLPYIYIKKWRLPLNNAHAFIDFPLTVSCGTNIMNARISFDRKKRAGLTARIRASLAKTLGLHRNGFYNIQYSPQRHRLKFGPVLGILTEGIFSDKKDGTLFGSMTRFYSECHQAAAMKGILLFVFGPKQINMFEKNIQGWVYTDGQWKLKKCPFPDVIYNRITSRRAEDNKLLQQTFNWLKEHHQLTLFNEKFLNKWEVHSALLNDSKIANVLPHTVLYTNNVQVMEMLKKYKTIYIKPVNGSLGQGVIRLTKDGSRYHMQHTTLNGLYTKTNMSPKEIARQLNRRRNQRPYIIQQGLSLLTSQGRNIDFRALVQKNGYGQWSITSIVGRIAKETSIVSNSSRGGTIMSVPSTIQHIDPHLPKPNSKQLRYTALQVARAFERQVKGHYAELGIDLAVDRKGKIWLLEINSKPSKTDNAVMNPEVKIRPSVYKTMAYTCFITGFKKAPSRTKVIP